MCPHSQHKPRREGDGYRRRLLNGGRRAHLCKKDLTRLSATDKIMAGLCYGTFLIDTAFKRKMQTRCDTIGKHLTQIVCKVGIALTLGEASSNETRKGGSTNVITGARINMQGR